MVWDEKFKVLVGNKLVYQKSNVIVGKQVKEKVLGLKKGGGSQIERGKVTRESEEIW